MVREIFLLLLPQVLELQISIMQKIAELVPSADIIRFSDLGLSKTWGIGVAMGNAIPEVEQAADCITLSCDQDGVAW